MNNRLGLSTVAFLSLSMTMIATGCNKPKDDKTAGKICVQPRVDTQEGFNIVNGITTTGFPSVVNMITPIYDQDGTLSGLGSCTGTFVSSTTMITASHCVDNSVTGGFGLNKTHDEYPTTDAGYNSLVNGLVKPIKVFRLVDIDANPKATNRDVAVAIFPKGTAPATSKMLLRSAEKGESATIVGFGRSNSTSAKDKTDRSLIKRVGYTSILESTTSNKFWSALTGGMVLTTGPNKKIDGQTSGQNATTAPGDSGGPLYINDALAAITHGGRSLGARDLAEYVDLANDAVVEFFKMTNAQGAKIPLDSTFVDDADDSSPPQTSDSSTGTGNSGNKGGTPSSSTPSC